MRKILHYKKSRLANAPNELVSAINAWSKKYRALLCGPGSDFGSKPDLVHFHNYSAPIFPNVPRIMQYHSEPERVDLHCKMTAKLVISQYHCTLPQYSKCRIVRNVINFPFSKLYKDRAGKILRIGYSPSRKTKGGKWFDKGFSETAQILMELKKENAIEIDIITKVPLNDCLRRKAACHIIIDECVTGSYHRSGLEGAAMAKLTFCNLMPQLHGLLKNYGDGGIPFEICDMTNLKRTIQDWIDCGLESIRLRGAIAGNWMHRYWHPKDIVAEFEKIYDEIIDK